MKKSLIIIASFIVLFFSNCSRETKENVRVTRDCTGTYLQIDGYDYLVCNFEELEGYAEGATAKVTYKDIDECLDYISCMLYHPHEGVIEVIKVK